MACARELKPSRSACSFGCDDYVDNYVACTERCNEQYRIDIAECEHKKQADKGCVIDL